jgi:hypothetical protein
MIPCQIPPIRPATWPDWFATLINGFIPGAFIWIFPAAQLVAGILTWIPLPQPAVITSITAIKTKTNSFFFIDHLELGLPVCPGSALSGGIKTAKHAIFIPPLD